MKQVSIKQGDIFRYKKQIVIVIGDSVSQELTERAKQEIVNISIFKDCKYESDSYALVADLCKSEFLGNICNLPPNL